MRVRLVAAAVACASIASFATAGSAGAAGCPNELFRVGPAALLPACRAYEMVSPPDKNGGSVSSAVSARTNADGTGVSFYSSTAFAGAGGSPFNIAYLTRRGANWTTESVEPPQRNPVSLFEFGTTATAPDMSKSLSVSVIASAPGAIEGGSNLYLRDNTTGQRRVLVATPDTEFFESARGSKESYAGGTDDWSNFLVKTPIALTPDSETYESGAKNLYEVRDGTLKLASILPNGGRPEEGATEFGVNAVSDDGSRVTFVTATSERAAPIYQRVNGAQTIPISYSQRTPQGGFDPEKGEVVGGYPDLVTSDGFHVFFSSPLNLVEDDQTGGTETIYRYDVATQKLTDLIPGKPEGGAQVSNFIGGGDDGETLYFLSSAVLAPGAQVPAGEDRNFYALHRGALEFIGEIPETSLPAPASAVSSNGRYLAFTTRASLTGADGPSTACGGEVCPDVYLFDSETKALACVTCTPSSLGSSTLGGGASRFASGRLASHAVLDDGTVFVETPNRLASRDVDGLRDVYAWRAGATSLISTGSSDQPSYFADATPSGSDVFFVTSQQLVVQDIDNSPDLYDFREGGGLASQFPPSAPSACEGESCRPISPAPPGAAPSGGTVGEDVCAGISRAVGTARQGASSLGRQAKAAARIARHGDRADLRRARKLGRRAKTARKHAAALAKQAKTCRGGVR